MLWLLLSAIGAAIFFWYYLVKPLRYWKERGVKQTKPHILVGDKLDSILKRKSFIELISHIYNSFPDSRYIGMYQFNVPILLIRDPKLIKQITIKSFDHFTDHRTFLASSSEPLWEKNLVALKGQEWREMRATLSSIFTSSKMKFMFNLIAEVAKNFTDYFYDQDKDFAELDMKKVYTKFTNDVIASAAFGIQVDSLNEPNNEFYAMGQEATNFNGFFKRMKFLGFAVMPNLMKMLRFKIFNKKISNFFTSVISETIRVREKENIVRPDMINILLEARKGIKRAEEKAVEAGFAAVKESEVESKPTQQPQKLTDLDITAQALIFFFAGFETISTAICFASCELAVNPDIQDRLREEINETLKQCNGKVTYDTLLGMKYLDMVASESLRKWTPAPVTDRVCTKPYTIEPENSDESPVHLKKGDVVFLPMYAIHRDPTHYSDPEKFDPERFSDENKKNIDPYSYFPFGQGPRNCIGSRFALLEFKCLLFHLLSKFELVPTEKTKTPLRLDRNSLRFMLEGGFWLGLKRIKN